MDTAAAWLKKNLQFEFVDSGLLELSLTHRSAGGESNERLEFLGDAVLDCVLSKVLYRVRPDVSEGDLSRLRAWLVNDAALAGLADTLGVGEQLRLGSGEKKTGGHRRASILADALEALFGAAYLDQGFAAAESLILHVYAGKLEQLPDSDALKDPKTRLQEKLQAGGNDLPEYEVTDIAGKPHKRRFTVSCRVPALSLQTVGNGSSRRSAEQQAAELLLAALADRRGGAA